MINRTVDDLATALADVPDGATILIGGFGGAGSPTTLIDGLLEQGARDLTIVSNNAGNGETGLAALLKARRVRRIVCSFPRSADSQVFDGLYRAGEIELELVPQGNLAERLRAAGAGIGAFFTPTGFGTALAEGKETRRIDGRDQVLEYPIHGDVALIRARQADRWGNLTYNMTARNFQSGDGHCGCAVTDGRSRRYASRWARLIPEHNRHTRGLYSAGRTGSNPGAHAYEYSC